MRILLIIYDNDAFVHYFPQGLAYIASVLRQNGHYIEIYDQAAEHTTVDDLKNFLNKNEFNIVGLSVTGGYYQYKKLLEISNVINNLKTRPFYIIGGHGPAADPNYFIEVSSADVVVIGEGEETIIEILKNLENKISLSDVQGIAYKDGNKVKMNPRRKLIKNIDDIPFPAYDLFNMKYYRLLREPNCKSRDFVMSVLSGRGCTFKCNFCFRLDRGFRPRSSEGIIEEIKMLQKNYRINYIAFSDELLMSSPKRTIELCEAIIKANLNIKWSCNGRLNYASKEVIKIMKESGCVFINYGIECYDDQILKNMNKSLTTEQIKVGIENTLEQGISPGFNIIFGNIDEDERTLKQGVDFLLKYDDYSQMRTIRPVTPYPGSDLYYLAIEQGKLKDCADFYENKHKNSDLLTINFTKLTDEEYYNSLYRANKKLLDNYFEQIKIKNQKLLKNLYFDKDDSFRGFRHFY